MSRETVTWPDILAMNPHISVRLSGHRTLR